MYNATSYGENVQLEEYGNFSRVKKSVITIVVVIVTLLGLLGNGIVIRTIRTHTKMRTPTYVLILNLAFVNFLIIAIYVPFVGMAYVLPKYILGECGVRYVRILYTSAHASVYKTLY